MASWWNSRHIRFKPERQKHEGANPFEATMRYGERYTKEKLEEAIKNSLSVMDVLRYLNIRLTGGSHKHISRRIKKLNLDTSHFLGMRKNSGPNHVGGCKKLTASEILVIRTDGRRQQAVKLVRALKEIGRKYECEHCKNDGNWCGEQLVLEVDHINEDWQDDRQENLRFLCPNCHAVQTKKQIVKRGCVGTADDSGLEPDELIPRAGATPVIPTCIDCGKKRDKKATRCKSCAVSFRLKPFCKRPSIEQLKNDIIETNDNKCAIARKYSVSDNAVRKWLIHYNLAC